MVAAALIVLSVPTDSQAQSTVEETSPPVDNFFAKYIDCEGIPVRSSSAVDGRALQLACDKITMMLQNIPSVKASLMRQKTELHIIGRDEQTSDLPEFRARRGVVYTDNKGKATTIDLRTRGMGGRLASCGEENILHLPGDRYGDGSDICVHEFAHTIMNYGFTPQQRQRIQEQYDHSMAQGLWQKAYAATNAQEYWAELSMWYFGSHGSRAMSGTPPADGKEGLQAYDPDSYHLLDQLYHGSP